MDDVEFEQAVQEQKNRLQQIIHQTGEMIASINFLEALYDQAEAGALTLDSLEHACHVFQDSGQGYQPWIDQITDFCHEARTLPTPVEADLTPGTPYFQKLETLLVTLSERFEE